MYADTCLLTRPCVATLRVNEVVAFRKPRQEAGAGALADPTSTKLRAVAPVTPLGIYTIWVGEVEWRLAVPSATVNVCHLLRHRMSPQGSPSPLCTGGGGGGGFKFGQPGTPWGFRWFWGAPRSGRRNAQY